MRLLKKNAVSLVALSYIVVTALDSFSKAIFLGMNGFDVSAYQPFQLAVFHTHTHTGSRLVRNKVYVKMQASKTADSVLCLAADHVSMDVMHH